MDKLLNWMRASDYYSEYTKVKLDVNIQLCLVR